MGRALRKDAPTAEKLGMLLRWRLIPYLISEN